MLVIDTLAEDNGSTVSDEEVAAEIAMMQDTPQYANENLDTDEARDAVSRILRRRTAIDQVIEITHKPKAAKASAKKSTATKKKTAAKAKAKPAAKKKPASSAKAKSPSKAAKSDK
jgi:FKBP-type peptidyl-prolyl cis-trans isomerase (trigger factor)